MPGCVPFSFSRRICRNSDLKTAAVLSPCLVCCTSAQKIEHHQLKSPPDSRTPSSWLEVLRLLRAFLSLGKVPNGLLEWRHTRMTLLGLDYRVNGVLPRTHSSMLRSLNTWRRTATPQVELTLMPTLIAPKVLVVILSANQSISKKRATLHNYFSETFKVGGFVFCVSCSWGKKTNSFLIFSQQTNTKSMS